MKFIHHESCGSALNFSHSWSDTPPVRITYSRSGAACSGPAQIAMKERTRKTGIFMGRQDAQFFPPDKDEFRCRAAKSAKARLRHRIEFSPTSGRCPNRHSP